jgi:hypothetical protein
MCQKTGIWMECDVQGEGRPKFFIESRASADLGESTILPIDALTRHFYSLWFRNETD